MANLPNLPALPIAGEAPWFAKRDAYDDEVTSRLQGYLQPDALDTRVAGLITGKANSASPIFTGNPTAPTPLATDDDTSIATTAFVKDQGYATLASPIFTGDPTAPTPATADNDTSIATTAFVKAQGYATLASPIFTGNPTAPTAATTDNDTSVATTAFVKAAIAATALAPASGLWQNVGYSSPTAAFTINSTTATQALGPIVATSPTGGTKFRMEFSGQIATGGAWTAPVEMGFTATPATGTAVAVPIYYGAAQGSTPGNTWAWVMTLPAGTWTFTMTLRVFSAAQWGTLLGPLAPGADRSYLSVDRLT